eukprot:TRINITY_DN23476_c0_g2_i1.p1 TRINITY_DN23476_c0_g2~~TRINITY_DN23476_c0_g2_i1.p1  ORF type:complete len:427 (-),score=51.36 TRINITY_DN23476_c0_g2_i1:43-1275(-)
MSRPYDILLWGCTGFTGTLVAEYFARDVSGRHPQVKWALAGRSQAKVQEVKSKLQAQWPGVDPPIILGTADDQASVDAAVQQCKVVLSTAGPYLKRGTPVVDACVRLGTHYVDITGETSWVADLLDRYHDSAEEKGVFIVPMSGYDSIPSDLGALFAVKHVRKLFGQPTRRVRCVAEMAGSLSGGTLATGIELGRDYPEHRERQEDPFCMGGGTLPRPEDEDQITAVFDDDLQTWTQPFMMASLNTRVVRRSNAWLHYGSNFSYSECQKASGRESAMKAEKREKQMRQYAAEVWKMSEQGRESGKLPKQGEGPSAEVMRKSWFRHHLVATAADGRKLLCQVSGGDPGYMETAKMLSESALCLLLDRERLFRRGGVLTPAAAGGMVLVQRLQDAGIAFEFVRELPAAQSKL